MARYRKDYEGERRTEKLTVQLTHAEREMLERGAQKAGATLSQHARELWLRRSAAVRGGAANSPNPDWRALVRELTAIGNNLNQLARVANTNRAVPQYQELKSTTDLLKAALSRVVGG
jgi:Bacterial mobilisation protein (MobC)